jgi:hypothetical protein
MAIGRFRAMRNVPIDICHNTPLYEHQSVSNKNDKDLAR